MNLKEEFKKLCKEEGLDLAEEVIAKVAKVGFLFAMLALPRFHPILSAIAAPVLKFVKPKVMALIDKIDGEDDEGR